MKKFFKLFALAGMVCLAAVACKKDPTDPGKDEGKQDPATLTAPTLAVSPASVIVSPESEEIALTFSWNDVAVKGITPVYAFQITKKGDNDFASGTAFECPITEKKFSHAELVSLAGEIGASLDEGFSLIARVRVTAKDNKDIAAVVSNVVEASVTKEQYQIDNIYPIGNATPYGWSLDKTEPMAKSGSTFTWTGHIYANADIKFLLQNDGWWPGIVNKSDDPYTYEPVIGFSDAEDKKFKVDKEGKYTVTIDAANTNALKIQFQFIDDDIQTLVVDHLYILGSATKTGWSLDAMEEFEKNGNVFTWQGELTADNEFRFPMQRDWWPCLMIAMDGKTLVKGVSDDEKTGFVVDEDGIWKIVCDVDKMQASITKVGEVQPIVIEELFILGDATATGWSLDDMESFTKNGNIFTWEGQLTAGGEFRFPLQRDWWPSLMFDMDGKTLVLGKGDNDKIAYTVDESAAYKIVLDVSKMEGSVTKK